MTATIILVAALVALVIGLALSVRVCSDSLRKELRRQGDTLSVLRQTEEETEEETIRRRCKAAAKEEERQELIDRAFSVFKDAGDKILAELYNIRKAEEGVAAFWEEWGEKLMKQENERVCKEIESELKEEKE